MNVEYECLSCEHSFAIETTEAEAQSSLDSDRKDGCPRCTQRVGTGPVNCRVCSTRFALAFPHAHVHCTLAKGTCPSCASSYVSLCVC